ncbi:hypothetical protein NC661_06335 [Aquibacillus koreensis]|uniref:Uncharacterized protein n=1 Tax=Aquibacillus koreensis TaxID=279446 RepID=A0A9X3WMH3_9BACI|nr:hypothetical protein [Aquibacillus koreensis]MCT2535729.1 hypothetical protein [Aquibacillus koreensis]MDC3419986.1 hypothetical protein [Aquibacillus koreensis]
MNINISSMIMIGLMIVSWVVGFYFLQGYYDTTLIIPSLNDYIWTTPFKGILGLTSIFTAVTLLLFFLQIKFKQFFHQKKYFYFTHISNHLLWIAVVSVQVKVILFNLGICH